ncbi:MAG: hypothetical protein EPN79_10985 [Burkholderiaceae bacterium]|nr:MAG: hypothetical protein EPN79_10985 [Burkholderiaceae bacterium]TBR76792.1 MAG: hypothetical protein EPN64_06090 [Burkholderiaceae bacterium]
MSSYRVACALYSPYAADFTLPIEQQLLQIDCIFAVIDVDGVDYGWIDGIDEDDPILVPVRSMMGYGYLGSLEEYLSEDFHAPLGQVLQDLLLLAQSEQLSATVLVRALAILHLDDAITAADAVQQSFQWGLTLLRAGTLERVTFGVQAIAQARVANRYKSTLAA